MAGFVIRRLAAMVVVLFAVSVLTFLIFTVIPNGDPAVRMAGRHASPQLVEQIRREWGFDQGLVTQYVTTMEKLFTGELVSYANRVDVLEEIGRGLPRTLLLVAGAAVLWLVGGIALGLFAATRAGRWPDAVVTGLALVGMSLPVFWLGALASYYLGYRAGIFPNGGYETIAEGGVLGWLHHLLLPWLVLATVFVGVYARVVRSAVLDTMRDDHVRTARAKGLSERRVLVRHVLRNALIPVVTLWGLDVSAALAGGAILTETVFDLQGVGQYFAESIARLDVPPVLAITMLGAFTIVVLNTVVDLVYAFLDPRVRLR
jgi:peptide/nickel transport system permease protein